MNADGSRPTAYNVEAKLLAQAHGAPVVLLNDQVELMFGHIWQWMNRLLNKPVVQIGKESNGKPVYETYYVRPFMAALTCEAMIQWAGDDMTRIRRVLAAIQPFWDQLWYMCWLPDSKSMMYTNCLTSAFSSDIPGYNTGDQQPSPDLNLLISPVFAWMYKWTGQVGYRDKHDSLFIGGVNQADITQGKQFNQNYRWSIQGLEWRG